MAETPKEVEINTVMGAQTRSIVRSALLHVRNKMMKDPHKAYGPALIDAELIKWPLSTVGKEDELPAWLYDRYSRYSTTLGWADVPELEREHWEHEAAAVRRQVGQQKAVGPDAQGGPWRVVDAQLESRHQMLGDVLRKYYDQNGQPMVSIRQVQDILCGRATADQYESALQVMPTGVLE